MNPEDISFHTTFNGAPGVVNFVSNDGWQRRVETSGVFNIPQDGGAQMVHVNGNVPDSVVIEIKRGGALLAMSTYVGAFAGDIRYGVNNGGPR